MKRWILVILLVMLLGGILSTWLWVGIVKDPEFAEYGLRVKRHPSFKVYFYTPLGMSDKTIDDLPTELQAEEHAYRRYILGTE
jgi:hypothetical protein